MTTKNCLGPVCLSLEPLKGFEPLRLKLSGIVRDERCEPISGAEIHFWQIGRKTGYGSLRTGTQDGLCRNEVFTDRNGRFETETEVPTNYGLTSGTLDFDIPPYVPSHVHAMVYADGYEPITVQIYFEHDVGRFHDWRDIFAKLGNQSLGSTDDDSVYKMEKKDGFYWAYPTFTLKKAHQPKSREAAIKNIICPPDHGAIALTFDYCFPKIAKYFQWSPLPVSLVLLIFLAYVVVPGVLLTIVLLILRVLVSLFRGTSTQTKSKRD
jgi:hypothetical protein